VLTFSVDDPIYELKLCSKNCGRKLGRVLSIVAVLQVDLLFSGYLYVLTVLKQY